MAPNAAAGRWPPLFDAYILVLSVHEAYYRHMKKLIITLTALLLTLNVAWADTLKKPEVPSAAPAKLPPGYIINGGLTWAPITATPVTLAEAINICSSSTALGYKWRLPTKDELVALTRYDGSTLGIRHEIAYRSNVSALRSQGWTLYDVWSSTPGTVFGLQFIVNLEGGITNYGDENGVSHVSCVK
ncbi:conserved protein of unknown function [Candidatus Nitrotoga arctica]|uniref:Lcl C-terminal domain-containing protein n=2 Tax=Candidatus Nitrotoga arctica TaxID=453162 RepID=A0ABM8YVD4_9PROT|nr:conserved protein of unknown function [Candidatus Nitrotoga arctica]